jgi:tetratricopeptide (TPR) repeat protein
LQDKDRSAAVELAEQAISFAPGEAIYHYRLALVHGRFGGHTAAEPPIRAALRLAPDFAPAYSLCAWIYFARRDFERALESIDEALSIDPHEPYALSLRIEVQQAKGNPGAAHSLAMEALRVNPENAYVHRLVGTLELRKNNLQSAVSHFRDALNLSPDSQSVQEAYATALERQSGLRRVLLQAGEFCSQPVVIAVWPLCWMAYLAGRDVHGPVVRWPWPGALMAVVFHAVLLWAWWGPLLSYALLFSNPEMRRAVHAKRRPFEVARLRHAWQIIISAAIAASTVSLVFPGNQISGVVSLLVFAGFASVFGRIALRSLSRRAWMALMIIAAIAIAATAVICLTLMC